MPSPAPSYLRTAASPRMLGLLLLLLGAAAVCARLGVWQLDRAQVRGDVDERAELAELTGAPADPIAEVLAPQSGFSGELVGHKVMASGTFDVDPLLVVGRALDGRTGYLLLDPLRVEDSGYAESGVQEPADGGSASALPVLPVVRGWVETVQDAAALAPAPSGTVRVTGYLQGGEAGGDGGLPPGQVDAVSPAELVNRWGGPIYSGYLVLTEISPPQDPGIALLPPPSIPGGGLDVRNLAYAVQWWIFGGFALILWVRLVRDETRAFAEETLPDQPGGPASPAEPGGPASPAESGGSTAPEQSGGTALPDESAGTALPAAGPAAELAAVPPAATSVRPSTPPPSS